MSSGSSPAAVFDNQVVMCSLQCVGCRRGRRRGGIGARAAPSPPRCRRGRTPRPARGRSAHVAALEHVDGGCHRLGREPTAAERPTGTSSRCMSVTRLGIGSKCLSPASRMRPFHCDEVDGQRDGVHDAGDVHHHVGHLPAGEIGDGRHRVVDVDHRSDLRDWRRWRVAASRRSSSSEVPVTITCRAASPAPPRAPRGPGGRDPARRPCRPRARPRVSTQLTALASGSNSVSCSAG